MQLVKASRDALLKPLQVVSGIVERRQTLPILANILVRKDGERVSFTATDLELQIQTSALIGAGKDVAATTVAARKLVDILRALPESDVQLSLASKKLAVASGKSRFNLQTLAAEEFPTVAQAEFTADFSLPAATLKYLLSMVHFAMAQQDIRYYLNGMLLVVDGATVRAVATDGHRLALCEVQKDGASPKIEAIIPRKTILELSRLLPDNEDPVRVQMAATQVKFSFGDIELISKLVEGKFPDYQRVVPAANTKTFVIGREDLMHALQRAAILTTDKFKGVRLVAGSRCPEDQLDQRRPGRRPGRTRDRLHRRRTRYRIQRELPARCAAQRQGRAAEVRAGRCARQRPDDAAGVREVQVRRHADENLSR